MLIFAIFNDKYLAIQSHVRFCRIWNIYFVDYFQQNLLWVWIEARFANLLTRLDSKYKQRHCVNGKHWTLHLQFPDIANTWQLICIARRGLTLNATYKVNKFDPFFLHASSESYLMETMAQTSSPNMAMSRSCRRILWGTGMIVPLRSHLLEIFLIPSNLLQSNYGVWYRLSSVKLSSSNWGHYM